METPRFGCEHLNQEYVNKIQKAKAAHASELGPSSALYQCLQCLSRGNLLSMSRHCTKTRHTFAVSTKSTYCGQCKDLVYEPGHSSEAKKRKLAEISDEDDSYMTANTAQKICGREGVRGLFNLGETCYMNAVLQMMVHNQLLSSYFLGNGHPLHTCPISKEPDKKNDSDSEDDDSSEPKPEQKTCVACGMTEVFSDSRTADLSIPAHAVNLLYASWKAIPLMAGKGQQDAQEWFMMIVDRLHETIKPSLDPKGRCQCFFHKAFFGRFKSEVTCQTCHAVSSTPEEYSSISLDFKKQAKRKKKSLPPDAAAAGKSAVVPNVLDCLKSYTAPEASEDYQCRSCGVPRAASKRLRIRKLPAILSVHVKRFGTRFVNNTYVEEKYGGKLEFPLALDMAPYTTTTTTTTTTTSAKSRSSTTDRPRFMYDLESVVVHQGEHVHNGHYYAFCKQDDKWFRFDDEIVSATTTEDVLGQEAYLLFYSLRSIG